MNVLVYPNMTHAKGGRFRPEEDSYVVLLGAILRRLAVSRPELRFTLLTPVEVESLWLPNTEQIEYPLPTYPNLMRTHFDSGRFLEAVDWKRRSWDVVWSHLPEHTAQIRNVFFNSTDERPVIVGYCHWFELPPFHNMAADMFDLNLAGIASMDYCGVNSEWLKRHVLAAAFDRVSVHRYRQLAGTIWPQTLGSEAPTQYDVLTSERGLLIWNHRPDTYTGFPKVLEVLDQLWERRQDFRLSVTMGDAAGDRPYSVPSGNAGTRDSYFSALSRGWFGLPRINCQWAVSVADGIATGLPYIVPRDFCYPEMFPVEYPFFYQGDFQAGLLEELDRALSAPIEEWVHGSDEAAKAAEALSWDRCVGSFERMFDWAGKRLPRIGDSSKRYHQLRKIADRGATKAELKKAMGWGIGIPWTPYRTRMRDDGVAVNGDQYGSWEVPDASGNTYFEGARRG